MLKKQALNNLTIEKMYKSTSKLKFKGGINMIQVKKKDVINSYYNVICVGYCNLQYLLKCKDAKMYNSGVYGWNAWIYHINNNTCIVTGYRPFGNIRPKHELITKYEEIAKDIVNKTHLHWNDKNKLLNKLLNEFIDEVIENDN